MKLYPYQEKNHRDIIDYWNKYQSILYQLPTGGGKTVVINSIIETILDKKILILVHRQEIIFQIRDRLKARGIKAGVLIGTYEENINADILIGSILTVARDARLENILNKNFDYMIIDEAHHACSNSYMKTITQFKHHNPNYKLLGVTATPYRKDGKPLNKIFDALILGPTYSELRKDGYLADYKCYAAKLDNLEDVDLSGGDYKISSLSKYMRSTDLVEKAIKMYKDKGENKQMLVFCVDKKHALQVLESYQKAGYNKIALIDSDTPDDERKSINQKYRNKELDIIISIQTLTEGVDLPNTGVIQMLRPTLSLVLYLQILGRGTRIKDDGSDLIILDLSNNSYTHGLLDSDFKWNLNNEEPNPNKKITKIIGRSKKGKITIDPTEIEIGYLEIEEMSHEDYLLQNINGVEIAENENKEKDQLIIKKYYELVKILNSKFKNNDVKFSSNSYFEGNPSSNYEEIKISTFDKSIGCVVYEGGKIAMKQDLYYSKIFHDKYHTIINLGKATEFIQKSTQQKLLVESFIEMKDIAESKVNIYKIKNKIEELKEEKCIFKINQQINQNNYKFKLLKNDNKDYPRLSRWFNFRDFYGWRNKVKFVHFLENPRKLKVINQIRFEFEDGDDYTHQSIKKEEIVKLLLENWYKE